MPAHEQPVTDPRMESAVECATHLALFGIDRYTGSPLSAKLKVTGVRPPGVGNLMAAKASRPSW